MSAHVVILMCPPTDLSLISKNLTELLKDVKDWNKIAYGLDIPETQCANFRTYSNESECKEACWDWYLKNRPSPTWKRIANELYQIYEHEVLEKLKRQYFECRSHDQWYFQRQILEIND